MFSYYHNDKKFIIGKIVKMEVFFYFYRQEARCIFYAEHVRLPSYH